MYTRGSSTPSRSNLKREFSPSRRGSTTYDAPFYSRHNKPGTDKYGGFLSPKEGHCRYPLNRHGSSLSSSSGLNNSKDDLVPVKNVPKCPDLISRGKCCRADCKYDHEVTKDFVDLTQNVKCKLEEALNNPSLAGKTEILLQYQFCHVSKYFLHFKQGFQEKPDSYRKWVMSMLELISTDSTGFFRHFQSNDTDCLNVFQTLVRADYSATAGLPMQKRYFSFQRCLLPLLFLLSHSEMESSPLHNVTNRIYSIYANQLVKFCIKFLACSMECLSSKSLEDNQWPSKKALEFDAGSFIPYSFAQVYFPFIKFLSIVLNRFPELMRSNQIRQLLDSLNSEILQWRQLLQDKALPTLETEFAVHIVERAFQPIKEGSKEIIDITAAILAKRNKEKELQAIENTYLDQWPDGPLDAPAGAHDNDFVDYKKVRIIPTKLEILSPHMPTLPGNQMSPYAHWLEPGPLRLLDTNFRLLRHDMFCSIQLGVKAVLQNLEQFRCSMRFKQRFGYQQVDLMVYVELSPHKMDFDYCYGSCLSIWYLLPRHAKSNYQLNRFFENCLLRDGLVALIRVPTKGGESVEIFFATIVTKNVSISGIKRGFSTVTLHFVDEGLQTTWMQSPAPYLMVEVRGLLFESYRPILNALQKIEPSNIPFSNILCSPMPLGRISPPCYMRAGQFKCNLNFLKSTNVKEIENLEFNPMQVDIQTFAGVLAQHTTLDKSQAIAVTAALSQEICCIQGPPGTGKSYLGVKVMQVLCNPLQDVCFPILVMTYTNHALDQFLESLLDEGIKSIARLGTKVSDRLKDYQLRNSWGGRSYYVMRKQLEEKITELEEQILQMNAITGIQRKKHFWLFLKRNFPGQSKNLEIFCRQLGVQGYIEYWLSGIDLDCLKKKRKKTKKIRSKFAELDFSSSEEEASNLDEDIDLDDSSPSGFQQPNNGTKRWDLIEEKLLNSYMEGLVLNTPALSELLEREDVWSLILEERKEVHSFWMYLYKEDCRKENDRVQQQLKELLTEYRQLKDQYSLNALKTKKIIGMTTTSCAKHAHLIQALQPKVIIVEEAGEVLEAHILASLGQWVQHLILIGDHLQLRPRIQEYSLSVESYEGKKYRLNESMFERLMKMSNFPKYRLTSQRRMRGPVISQFVRAITYGDLLDGENTKSYPNVKGIQRNVYFLDHVYPQTSGEESFGGHSHSNMYEVEMIVALTVYLLQQNYKPEQVVILTPYVGQLLKIREALAEKNMISVVDDRDQLLLNLAQNEEQEPRNGCDSLGSSRDNVIVEKKDLRSCIRVSSIDNYQGEESDVILISLVRSSFDDGSEKGIGFLSIENRINVMLSRARHGMFILGNASLLERKSKVWCKVIQLLREQDLLGVSLPIICQNHPETVRLINSPESLIVEAPDGGCLLPCATRLPCGHICERHCHSDDKDHQTVKCRKPCLNIHEPCKHPCMKLCFKKCGSCERGVPDIVLPGCGHVYPNPKCINAQTPSTLICGVHVERKRFCQHSLFVECSKDVNKQACTKICGATLPCGHSCKEHCSKCSVSTVTGKVVTDHGRCKQPCGRQLACQHTCKVLCFEHPDAECPPCSATCSNTLCQHSQCKNLCSDPCLPCMEKCTWGCEHEPLCPLPCGAPCIRLPCNRRCKRRLACGHICPSMCGEDCPDSKYCFECCDKSIQTTRVDLVLLREYHEIDVNETPILVLPCGHFFTYETLDAYFDVPKYYRQLGNQFVDVKQMDAHDKCKLRTCPDCRLIIQAFHIKRYSRIIKRAVLRLNDKHYTIKLNNDLRRLESKVNEFPKELESIMAQVSRRRTRQAHFSPTDDTKESYQLFKNMENRLKDFTKQLKENPSRRVYYAMHNFVHRPPLKPLKNDSESQKRQRIQEKLMDALEKTQIVRNYFVEEGKAYLLRYQLHKHFFTVQTQPLLLSNSSSIFNSTQSSINHENASIRALLFRFDEAKQLLDQALKLFEKGNADFRILEAHMRFFEFLSVYLELIHKYRKSRLFCYLTPRKQEEWCVLVDREVEDVIPKIKAMKSLIQRLELEEQDYRLPEYVARFQELREAMRQNSTLPLWEIGSIVSAMAKEIGGSAGHWYSCPNGHFFVIAGCGRAMQVSKCPDCKVPVGGTQHRLIESNQQEDVFVQEALRAYEGGA